MNARFRSVPAFALLVSLAAGSVACETTTLASSGNNARVVRKELQMVWSRGDLSMIDETHDPGFVWHVNGATHTGADTFRAFVEGYRSAMPDLELEIVDLLAEGERVVAHWVARGTQTGPLMELQPTGIRAEVDGFTLYLFRDGRIVEEWSTWNELGFLKQLGVIPAE